ncbi:flavin monoamine oxidase family protein [Tsukamurella sputi]|uniref:Flavin monoamine oxidase family protein n=1 Tax=Tsukamurella sputi TaxID=2591848 RepID=A0A5C5RU34_9ACTN|nr:flavin monoamine oxidase family protein [Tsukamurella sputi]TWS26304.1 flavin monoamine oxidase family protein [Tsukamurella sputi]
MGQRDIDGSAVDVVVIGAGFAGLTAADRLVERGATVLVLEGRDRVGGRAYSGEVAGVTVDLGATWVADRHTAVHSLVGELGCTTTPQYDKGDNLLWMAGRRQTYQGALPVGGPVDVDDLFRIQGRLEELLATIDVEAAWSSPGAAELDAISFGEWLDENGAVISTRELMAVVAKVQWGSGTSDVSLLHALRYLRAAGGLLHMLSVEGGQQQDRIVGGFQGIAVRLAEKLGDRVVLNAAVRSITQSGDEVEVHTDRGVVRGRYAISTTTPAHRADIDFRPTLPDRAVGLVHTWPMGTLSKAFVAFERPFWRDQQLSGEAIIDTGAVFITFDVSPEPDGPGILMAFCDPRKYDGFNAEDRRSRVLDELVRLYGEQAAHPIDYIDHCWGTETFAPGGPNPSVGPFATTSYGPALAEPFERIHWAGSETAGEWAGTLNGAVLTGIRAAEEVAGRLDGTDRVHS